MNDALLGRFIERAHSRAHRLSRVGRGGRYGVRRVFDMGAYR